MNFAWRSCRSQRSKASAAASRESSGIAPITASMRRSTKSREAGLRGPVPERVVRACQRVQKRAAAHPLHRRVRLGDVAAGKEIAGVTGHDHAVLRDAPFAQELVDRRPVLDVRNRGEIARRMEVRAERLAWPPTAATAPPSRGRTPSESPGSPRAPWRFAPPSCWRAVGVADHVAHAEVAQRHADEARVVAAGQRHDDRPPLRALDEALEHRPVQRIQPVDQRRHGLVEEVAVRERVVARALRRALRRPSRASTSPPPAGARRRRGSARR